MANVPIVTEVTKLQLDALVAANGLNEGLQYKVTDKDWLLTATSDATLKASTGVLLISNELFPSYISSDILMLNTGIITTDISYPAPAFEIIRPVGFNPQTCYYKSGVALTAWTIQDSNGEFDIFNNAAITEGVEYQSQLVPTIVDSSIISTMAMNPGNLYISAVGNIAPGFQVVIKFEKSNIS